MSSTQTNNTEKKSKKKGKSPAFSWFRHDLSAADDPKLIKVLMTFGYEGVGLYWTIIEKIYGQSNCLTLDKQVLAFCLKYDEAKLSSFIEALIDINLLKIVDGRLTSDRIQSEFQFTQQLSKKRANAGSKGGKQKPSKTQAKDKQKQAQTRQDKTRQDKTDREVIATLPPSKRERYDDPPDSEDASLPKIFIEYFQSRGFEEIYQNVWIPRAGWEALCGKYGDEAVNEAGTNMARWSVSYDISPKTGREGWHTYRDKIDHLQTLKNQIKRKQAAA